MYHLAALATEIRHAVSALETYNRSSILSKRWLTTAVLAQHDDDTTTPFSACCGRYTVEQAVDRCIRELRFSDLLPGFRRLQQRYLSHRDGESVAVPIHEMADGEIHEKAAELRAMGDGLHRHADELVRFVATRQEQLA